MRLSCGKGSHVYNSPNNRLDNLEWGTSKENAADKLHHGREPLGSARRSKLNEQQVASIRKMKLRHGDATKLAPEFGVDAQTIRRIWKGQGWPHVSAVALLLLLAACAGREPVRIHEPPRVERLLVPDALLAPCPPARDGAPDPATATFLNVATYLVQLAARNDQCAAQVDGLRVLLAP